MATQHQPRQILRELPNKEHHLHGKSGGAEIGIEGTATMTGRVEAISEDMDTQALKDLSRCEYFSLQFEETLDVMNTTRLVVFVKMAFPDSTTKEDFLTLFHLKDKTRDEDIYNEFTKYVCDNDIPIYKLVAITTDRAPAMRGVHARFIALSR